MNEFNIILAILEFQANYLLAFVVYAQKYSFRNLSNKYFLKFLLV